MRAPELAGRGWLNTGGRDARRSPTCAAGSSSSTSGPSAASTACTSSTSCARWRSSTPTRWSSSACTRRSSSTRPTPTRSPPPSSGTPCTTRCSTTPSSSPGRPTPPAPGRRWWSSTPRATSSRRCRVRATPTASSVAHRGAHRGAPRQGHAAPRRRPVRPPPAPATRRCASRARRPRCRTGRSSSPTPRTTRSSTSRPTWSTERRRFGGDGHVQRAAGRARRCRRSRRRGSATTSSSPTRVHHQVKGLRWPTARSASLAGTGQQLRERSGSGPALRAGPVDAVGPRVVHRPGRHRHGRHPPAVGAAPGHRPAPTTPVAVARPARRPRASATAPAARGVVRPAVGPGGLRRRAPRSGSPTPRPPRCARSTSTDDGFVVDHPRRAGPVRLRPPRRRRRPGAAAAPARRHRAARRLGGGQRHLQRRHPPVRPRHRRGRHAGHGPARAQRRGRRASTATGATRLVVVESAAHQLTRVPLPDGAQRVDGLARRDPAPAAPRSPPGDVTLSGRRSPRRPARSSTTAGATRPG